MSISGIPTELDKHILSYLQHDSLNAISKVSKYYRGIAEPYLYRNLKFDGQKDSRIRWLVLTLVARPDVAKNVKTLKVSYQHEDGVLVKHKKLIAMLWNDLQNILSALENILKLVNPMNWQVEWTEALTGRKGLLGCLAFLLCHTVNIESIDMDFCGAGYWESFFFALLRMIREKRTLERTLSLSKLRDLRLKSIGVSYLPFFPELQSLTIERDYRTLTNCASSANAISKIHTLTLKETSTTAASLCQLLKQQQLRNLQSLRMFEAFANDTQGLGLLLQSLRDQCPKLESLECFNRWRDLVTRDMPVRGFQELHNLKILRIDMEMLVENNGASGLPHPATALPPNLEVLHLSSIPRDEFISTVSTYLNNTSDRQTVVRYINCLVSAIPLRDISVSIMERFEDDDDHMTPVRLSSDMKKYLNSIACTFLAMGVKLSFGKLTSSHYDSPLKPELLVDAEFITDT